MPTCFPPFKKEWVIISSQNRSKNTTTGRTLSESSALTSLDFPFSMHMLIGVSATFHWTWGGGQPQYINHTLPSQNTQGSTCDHNYYKECIMYLSSLSSVSSFGVLAASFVAVPCCCGPSRSSCSAQRWPPGRRRTARPSSRSAAEWSSWRPPARRTPTGPRLRAPEGRGWDYIMNDAWSSTPVLENGVDGSPWRHDLQNVNLCLRDRPVAWFKSWIIYSFRHNIKTIELKQPW